MSAGFVLDAQYSYMAKNWWLDRQLNKRIPFSMSRTNPLQVIQQSLLTHIQDNSLKPVFLVSCANDQYTLIEIGDGTRLLKALKIEQQVGSWPTDQNSMTLPSAPLASLQPIDPNVSEDELEEPRGEVIALTVVVNLPVVSNLSYPLPIKQIARAQTLDEALAIAEFQDIRLALIAVDEASTQHTILLRFTRFEDFAGVPGDCCERVCQGGRVGRSMKSACDPPCECR